MDPLKLLTDNALPFARLMGVEFVAADKDKVVARMTVRPDLCTLGSILHGGAVMALADTVGAAGTFLNLAAGQSTTTIESKTNFIGAAPAGTTVSAEATPVHRGRRTQIWQTRIPTADGKLVAIVTQTQMVLGS